MKNNTPFLKPLQIHGTGMPANLLLMAKIIVVGLLCKGYLYKLSDHFVPLLPVFEHFGPSPVFETTLQTLFLLGSAGVLLNWRPRACCILLGLIFLVVPLSSILAYRNAKVFCGFILLMAGLHKAGETPWLVRLQVVLLYFGAGLNKLLDSHWQSGQYFEHWMIQIVENVRYTALAAALPPMLLSKIMCWATIAGEFVIAAGLLIRRYVNVTLWIGVFFHTAALILSWRDYGIFMLAILASYLAFVEWPDSVQVRTEGKRLTVTAGGKAWHNFFAVRRLLLYSPGFYLAVAALLGLSPPQLQVKAAEILLIFFFPVPSHWQRRG